MLVREHENVSNGDNERDDENDEISLRHGTPV